jgi:membrane-associated phospholipid phosphatase
MSLWIIVILIVVCGTLMALERKGLATTLSLTFKSDLKRETRFLAQYGQLVCTVFVALLIWQLDATRGVLIVKTLLTAWIATSIIGTLIKRIVGRARPKSEFAPKFLGPSFKHANYRESFPSSHSATAIALTVVLSAAYPHGAITFWALALICATLRYFLDAHWPSDVLGGIALGLAVATATCHFFGI